MTIDWSPIISNVLGILLAGVATALVAWLVQLARAKGFEISADQQAQLEYYAKQAALKVEELAKAKLMPDNGSAKLDAAIRHVVNNVPNVTVDQARSTVLAVLPTIPGVGAVTLADPPKAA